MKNSVEVSGDSLSKANWGPWEASCKWSDWMEDFQNNNILGKKGLCLILNHSPIKSGVAEKFLVWEKKIDVWEAGQRGVSWQGVQDTVITLKNTRWNKILSGFSDSTPCPCGLIVFSFHGCVVSEFRSLLFRLKRKPICWVFLGIHVSVKSWKAHRFFLALEMCPMEKQFFEKNFPKLGNLTNEEKLKTWHHSL